MRNDDIQVLIGQAAARGHRLDDLDARIFISAKTKLQEDPNDEHAREVVEGFMRFIVTGHLERTMAWFAVKKLDTDEEIAEREALRARL